MQLLTLLAPAVVALAAFASAAPEASGALAIREPAEEMHDMRDWTRKQHHRKHKKHHKSSKKSSSHNGGKATWYGKGQLDAPACGGKTPSSQDLIGAVAKGAGYGECWDWVTLEKDGKSVTIQIVDYCEGCDWGHYDLTQGAFKHLGTIDEGVINDLKFTVH